MALLTSKYLNMAERKLSRCFLESFCTQQHFKDDMLINKSNQDNSSNIFVPFHHTLCTWIVGHQIHFVLPSHYQTKIFWVVITTLGYDLSNLYRLFLMVLPSSFSSDFLCINFFAIYWLKSSILGCGASETYAPANMTLTSNPPSKDGNILLEHLQVVLLSSKAIGDCLLKL